MSCSHCADFHNDTLESLKTEYIDTGKVKFVFRDFPFNYPALVGSMILRCVPNDARYQYMNALYKLQKNWVRREHSDTKKELYKIMQSGGMQQEDFDACLSDINLENDILEDVMNAQKEFNIRSTPSFIINGVLYSGNKNIKEFRQIIDKILSQ
jgi:protein-disulfide isomerase